MKTLIISFLAIFAFFYAKFTDVDQFNYTLDTENSIIEWTGSGPAATHDGSFEVLSQGIKVIDGKIIGGSFTIPIVSIKNFDLPDEVKPVLLDHLKSEDFFNMALYPDAQFSITNVENLSNHTGDAVEGSNIMVEGEFTMLGKTLPIAFPAKVELKGDGLSLEARFKLDRTNWGMNYGADPALGDRHIFPEVDLHLKIAAHRKLS